MAPKVAVLGGTGWVGRHVCETFARRGYEVLVVARNPGPRAGRYRFAALDLAVAPPSAIADLLRVDVVVNATDALNATDGWARTEDELRSFNVGLVRRLIAAITTLPGKPRLVHLGTIFEYGPVPGGTLIDESVPPKPVFSYNRTKLAGSTAVLDAARAGAISAVALRVVNVCGPHPSPATFPGKLLALVREAEASGNPAELSIADARRDFVDVRDVAEACLKAAESAVTGRAINIGTGEAVALREFVALFLAAAGLPPSTLTERAAPVASLGTDWARADIRLAAGLLHWRPAISLPDSLRAMWESWPSSKVPVAGA
jgi:nucleoside-diphosphate-sugar epimerase